MISYISNLPADNSEHRVQLNVGENMSLKSYLSAAAIPARTDNNRSGTGEPNVVIPTKELFIGLGKVCLGARQGLETPVLSKGENIHWQVYEAQADFDGRRKHIAGVRKDQPVFTLNEGDYILEVKFGNASRMVDLNVKAGEQKSLEVHVTADR